MKDFAESAMTTIGSMHPWLLGILFVVLFVGSIMFVTWAVVQIPEDYFKTTTHRPTLWASYNPVLRAALIVAKNLLGLILVVVGIALLILPVQGLLTMVIGLLMLDVPGKFRFERWLLSHTFVLRPVNWLRAKMHKPALQFD